jgi:hypothetical protein
MLKKKFRIGKIFALAFTGTLLGLAIFAVLNKQLVQDTVNYWTFVPSQSVSEIEERIMLSERGSFLFYATRPLVASGMDFNKACTRKEENVAVIGCYLSNRIFIYDVTDERLNGIREVTAAHELLHAVYQRLSESERAKIDSLIDAEFSKLAADPALSERMAFYSRTEPGERNNELHSIIGTEIANIDSRLEKHYSQYFSNRQEIVQYYVNYNSEFTELNNRANTLSSRIDLLSKKIDSHMVQYNESINTLNRDIEVFNSKASNGGFASESVFVSERRILQGRIENLNTLKSSIESDVGVYEKLRTEYNQTVMQSQDLYKSIDSKLAPAPSI